MDYNRKMNRLKYKILLLAAATILTAQSAVVYAEPNASTQDVCAEETAEQMGTMEEADVTDATDATDAIDATDSTDTTKTTEVAEATEEEEEIVYGPYANSYIIADTNTMMCTNTLGGRKFGSAGDTTMGINLNEDITGSTGIKGSDIISYGFQFIGNPYVYGGSSLTEGCDCSGYVMAVLAHFGITVPHPSASLISCGGLEISKEDVRLGDVIIYNGGSHAAFYIGNGYIMDAESSGTGIVAGKRKAFTDWDGSEKNYVIRRFF